jgi:hypothetical protein
LSFESYVVQQLSASPLVTDPEDPKTDLFHASVESARVLFRWTQGLRSPAGEGFALELGFIDAMRPNALADQWNGRHYIGVHGALFVAICEFALFCFAQRDFFPAIGNAGAETSPRPWDDRVPGLWLLGFTAQGGHVDDDHSRQLIPKDPERFDAAIQLGQMMTRFAWLHELAHCFNGHVAFARRHNLAPRLYELAEAQDALALVKARAAPEKSAALKCIEFDADQSALWGSFNIQWRDLEPLEGIARMDKRLRVALTLFGAYAMIWLIDQFQTFLDTQQAQTHPAPSLRLQNLFRTAASNIVSLDPALVRLHADVLAQFDAIRAAIPAMYGADDLVARITDQARMEAQLAFDPRLEDIKGALKPFMFSAKA